MKYRLRPVVVDAIQWTGDNSLDIADFLGIDIDEVEFTDDDMVAVGFDVCDVNEWIIRHEHETGKLTVCDDITFNKTYEPVEPEEGTAT